MSYLEIVTLVNQLKQHLVDTSKVAILVSKDEWDAMVDGFCDYYGRVLEIDDKTKGATKAMGYGVIYGVTVMVDPKENQ